jgi:hypothetical protein
MGDDNDPAMKVGNPDDKTDLKHVFNIGLRKKAFKWGTSIDPAISGLRKKAF